MPVLTCFGCRRIESEAPGGKGRPNYSLRRPMSALSAGNSNSRWYMTASSTLGRGMKTRTNFTDRCDGRLDQPGALGVGEHSIDDAMLAGIELARAKIAVHAGKRIQRRIHVKRWSPEAWIRFYRVVMAIYPGVRARAGVPRQAPRMKLLLLVLLLTNHTR